MIWGYKTALMDLQLYKKSRNLYNYDHPNKNVIKAFIKNCQQGQHIMKKAAFEDKKKETIPNNYNKLVLLFIFDQFWQ